MMSFCKLTPKEMCQTLNKHLFEYFRCRKCHCHMEEVMEGFLCRHCFLKANVNNRLPDKPLRLFTGWSSESRSALDLRVPADYFGNEIVLRQLGELSMVKEQKVVKKNRNPKFEDHVEEYLRGLLVILVEPIISMTAVEFLEIKQDLMKHGVKFVNTSFKAAEKKKRIIIADLGPRNKHSRSHLDSLAKDFRCTVVELNLFLSSLKSGVCMATSSQMSMGQTPENELIMWENPFLLKNPSILGFTSYDTVLAEGSSSNSIIID